jgi:tetratricopeptide (TPR) repeat protein
VSRRDHGQCLTEETLTEYLEGGLDPPVKAASEVHLIACDDCRNSLGYFMRILQHEVKPEEATAIQAIALEWDERKSRQKRRRAGNSGFFLRLAALAAVLILAVVSVRFVLKLWSVPESADEIVQLLLSRHRPFESRMAAQQYGPIRRTRGTDDSDVSYGLIAAEMTKLSASSHEMGRFYLLQQDFGRAIPYLEIAEREVGASAAVHNDLGVAYLESGNATQVEKAEREFRHAVAGDPSFAAAVFNLAMLFERTGATAQAEAQWKLYLDLDSSSDWAKEARGRLQGLSR